MDNGETPFDTNDSEETNRGIVYIYGLGFLVGLFILIIIYCISYIYKRHMRLQPPPLPVNYLGTTNEDIIINNNNNNNHVIKFLDGLDDNILVSFPTFVYSDVLISHKEDKSSDCSICLADYKPSDVIRILLECGHFFHVKCIDTWLKVHPTCPVCRKSPLVRCG